MLEFTQEQTVTLCSQRGSLLFGLVRMTSGLFSVFPTPSDSLQRKNDPSEVSILAEEVGKGGTTLTELVTRPGHWGPHTIMAHIAGQVATVIPFPASFHHPGRKLVSLGQAESEQIASWPKNGSYSGK